MTYKHYKMNTDKHNQEMRDQWAEKHDSDCPKHFIQDDFYVIVNEDDEIVYTSEDNEKWENQWGGRKIDDEEFGYGKYDAELIGELTSPEVNRMLY